MSTPFERTIIPQGSSHPTIPGTLQSLSDSGKLQTRSTMRVGWTWEEQFFFKYDTDGRYFISRCEFYFNQGTELDVAHTTLTLLGAAGGTPLVDGASQTGAYIATKGWPISQANTIRGGDFIKFAAIDRTYQTRVTRSSDGAGDIGDLFLIPHIFEGGSPADNAAITVTDSVTFNCKLVELDLPSFGPEKYVVMRVRFREYV